jgi:hypothetical protein
MPCGRPPRNLASHKQALLTRLGAEPDATLAELRDWLAAERPVPYGHWKTTTFVAGLRCDGLTAPFVIDGPINGEWFYVEKVLAPTLRPGTLVPQRFGDLRYPTFAWTDWSRRAKASRVRYVRAYGARRQTLAVPLSIRPADNGRHPCSPQFA